MGVCEKRYKTTACTAKNIGIKMIDKCGKKIRELDIVEVIFYSYWEPICGAFFQMVNGKLEYLKGDIPEDYYTSEISCERYSKGEIDGIKNGTGGNS